MEQHEGLCGARGVGRSEGGAVMEQREGLRGARGVGRSEVRGEGAGSLERCAISRMRGDGRRARRGACAAREGRRGCRLLWFGGVEDPKPLGPDDAEVGLVAQR